MTKVVGDQQGFIPILTILQQPSYLPFIGRLSKIAFLISCVKIHCVKSVRIRRHSGTHFPSFGLNNSQYVHFLRSDSGSVQINKAILQKIKKFQNIIT